MMQTREQGHTGRFCLTSRPRFLAKKTFTKIHQHLMPIKLVMSMHKSLKYSENIRKQNIR